MWFTLSCILFLWLLCRAICGSGLRVHVSVSVWTLWGCLLVCFEYLFTMYDYMRRRSKRKYKPVTLEAMGWGWRYINPSTITCLRIKNSNGEELGDIPQNLQSRTHLQMCTVGLCMGVCTPPLSNPIDNFRAGLRPWTPTRTLQKIQWEI